MTSHDGLTTWNWLQAIVTFQKSNIRKSLFISWRESWRRLCWKGRICIWKSRRKFFGIGRTLRRIWEGLLVSASFLFIYFFNRMFNYLFLKIIAVVTIFYRRGSQKYVGFQSWVAGHIEYLKFLFFLPSVISSSSHQFSNRAGDAMAQLRKSHPFIASSIGLGMIIGGTAVLIPALGLMAMYRRRLNHPVCISSPQY